MTSFLLVSVLLAALVVPVIAAGDRNPRRGVKRMVAVLFVFNALYLAYLTLVYPFVHVPKQ
jgi:cytochrome c biogenesis factor